MFSLVDLQKNVEYVQFNYLESCGLEGEGKDKGKGWCGVRRTVAVLWYEMLMEKKIPLPNKSTART